MRGTASIALAAALVLLILPRVVGTTLKEVGQALGVVTGPEALVLAVLWALGLLTYSFVLTGALPGLRRHQALTLNLTGSAVANVLPFGGAAGMSLNYLMLRSWHFDGTDFSAYTLVTNLWNMLLKLALPAVAIGALVASGGTVSSAMRWSGLVGTAALTLVVMGLVGGLARRGVATHTVRWLVPPLAGLTRLVRRPVSRERVALALMVFRDRVASVVGRRWTQLSLATLGYGLLQAVLLWACVLAVGGHLSPVMVLAGYAVDRIMTMVILTPGGAGFAEAGAAAALVALGGDPALMAAGVLLYRGFTYALEIPVGGLWLAGWLLWRRRARAMPATRSPDPKSSALPGQVAR